MTDGHLYPCRVHVDCKRDVQPVRKAPASGSAHPRAPHQPSPRYVTLQPETTQTSLGRRQGLEWWTIKEAAYGNFFFRTALEPFEPFILPSENTTSNADVPVLKEIRRFNTELYRFYMTEILPAYYRCSGSWGDRTEKAGPIYVNAKQYHCILRRRLQRARHNRLTNRRFVRKKYLHESRHKHATKRLRNAHGRFVSKMKAEVPIPIPDAESTTTEESEKTPEEHHEQQQIPELPLTRVVST